MSSTPTVRAVCVLRGDAGVGGVIRLEQSSTGGNTSIKGKVTGLKAGLHGFHIHTYGDLSDGCKTAGAHYNPFQKTHGAPKEDNRHVGDLGNVESKRDGDEVTVDVSDHLISLIGQHSVIGRAFVVHEKEDDLGKGGDEESKKTGNAGGRLACGVIGISE